MAHYGIVHTFKPEEKFLPQDLIHSLFRRSRQDPAPRAGIKVFGEISETGV